MPSSRYLPDPAFAGVETVTYRPTPAAGWVPAYSDTAVETRRSSHNDDMPIVDHNRRIRLMLPNRIADRLEYRPGRQR